MRNECIKQAEKFSNEGFKKEIEEFVSSKYLGIIGVIYLFLLHNSHHDDAAPVNGGEAVAFGSQIQN